MKPTVIVLLLTLFPAALITAENSYYPNNREPLAKTKYVKLPLGAVKPKGWLYDELTVQANGLTGHLNDVWEIAHTSAWKGDAGRNVLPECCYPRFVPRWLEGLVPLAYQLDDERLIALANQYMGYLMTVKDPGQVSTSLVAWSHLGRVLQGYYEATGDKRAIELCSRILKYADGIKNRKIDASMSVSRLGMLLGFGWWGYNQTGDQELINIVNVCTSNNVAGWKDYFINFKDKTAQSNYLDKPGEYGRHGVDVSQAIQYPVSYYLLSKDEADRDSVFRGLANLDKYNGQVAGRWNADEHLAGLKPTQGTELCDVTELVYSLTKNFEALGDISFADRMEQLAFNAFPGTCTADLWAHQYDQQANQVLVSEDNRLWHSNNVTANVFGFTPNYPCCLANMHSVFPRFVENMWLATDDNGLIAAFYGPCQVKAKVGKNINATITEETSYPFSDAITFKVEVSRTSAFPLYFRIPAWADNTVITVGKETFKPKRGTVCRVERKWRTGDVVALRFHPEVVTQSRYNQAVSVSRGPLDFVLRIGQKFTQINIPMDKPLTPAFPTGVANWQIEPTTAWNYGLVIKPGKPEYALVHNPVSKLPFAGKGEPVFLPGASGFINWNEDVPVVLKMKARQVLNWNMDGGNAEDAPLNPVAASGDDVMIDLIPYGCTRLRISEFPVISQAEK